MIYSETKNTTMRNLTNFIKTLLFILLSVNILSSQSNFDVQTMTASVDINDGFRLSDFDKNYTSSTKAKPTKSNEIYFDISDVDLSTTIDVASNQLDFSGADNKKYTKIQLTHKSSNKTVLSRKVINDYKIDLNKIVPGTYILILSNENGGIKAEELTIF